MDELDRKHQKILIVHGGCPTGADAQADLWAKQKNSTGRYVYWENHLAEWVKYGKSAGMRRNAEMVKLGADLCLAFIHNDSKGASQTAALAEKARIPTTIYRSYSVADKMENVEIEDAKIVFRNFAGREGKFNSEGERSFSVVLDDQTADAMTKLGWNVKRKPPREEGDENFNHIPVKVEYHKGRPPRVVLITMFKGKPRRTNLDEDTVEFLDYADFKTIDLIIRPYEWAFNGNSGVKAYLHAIYATVNQDSFEQKYEEVPEIAASKSQLAITAGGDDWVEGEVVSDTADYE